MKTDYKRGKEDARKGVCLAGQSTEYYLGLESEMIKIKQEENGNDASI